MKYLKKYESPNDIYPEKGIRRTMCASKWIKDRFNAWILSDKKIDQTLEVTFFYDNRDKFHFYRGCDNHSSVAHNLGVEYDRVKDISGRVFEDEKILTFWKYPKDYTGLEKVIRDLEKANVKIDDSWKIEVAKDENSEAEPPFYEMDSDFYKYIPIKDFKGGKHSDDVMKTMHVMTPIEKEKIDRPKYNKVKNWKDWQKPFESFKNKDYTKWATMTGNRYKAAMEPMSLDETADYINENCKEWIETPYEIIRKINYVKIPYFKSKPILRFSRDNSNHYTTVLDNTWKDYPKRSRSFICSISTKNIQSPLAFVVIPKDGSKWGIAPRADIFYAFKKSVGYVDDFFTDFNKLSLGMNLDGINDTNFKELRKDFIELFDLLKEKYIINGRFDEQAYKLISRDYSENIANFIMDNYNRSSVDMFKELIRIMNPVVNDFSVQSYTEMANLHYKGNELEVWTDSDCVFVHTNHMSELVNKLGVKFDLESYYKPPDLDISTTTINGKEIKI